MSPDAPDTDLPPIPPGPNTAQRFVEDTNAYVALRRHDLPVPPQLELAAIRRRYMMVTRAENDADGMLCELHFLDGSCAQRDVANRTHWRERR